MQISLDEKEQAEINLVSARNEVSRLNEIESKLNESSSGTTSSGTISDIRANVNKYLNSITEDDIIDYIYSQIERDNKSSLD
ncbi:MAG: hypothetical protein LBC61_03595 [Candidatus Peribacteria bacterium]|jgi:hypothetical protein|nr:hypothetical protein [Candidatus Peribacteria bacterium]